MPRARATLRRFVVALSSRAAAVQSRARDRRSRRGVQVVRSIIATTGIAETADATTLVDAAETTATAPSTVEGGGRKWRLLAGSLTGEHQPNKIGRLRSDRRLGAKGLGVRRT
jgi:hypothetical protein